MKILKIFGVVVGIHVFVLTFIFANPGCSTASKPPPAPSDTAMKSEPAPSITVPAESRAVTVNTGDSPIAVAPVNFNPDAPASAAPMSGGIRFMPTRPNTPAASTLVVEPVTGITPATTYTVKSDDNLWNIAKKNGLTVGELAAQNNIKVSAVLQPGTKLVIPGKKPAAATPAAPAAAPPAAATSTKPAPGTPALAKSATTDGIKHTVMAGETLSGIAKHYGVKLGDIAVANNITDLQKIRPGVVLIIPGWQTPGLKSGKAPAAATKSGASAANGKATADPVQPLFGVPGGATDADSPIKAAPPPTGSAAGVPVIKVEDAPPPKKP